jgi:hypothetical protein
LPPSITGRTIIYTLFVKKRYRKGQPDAGAFCLVQMQTAEITYLPPMHVLLGYGRIAGTGPHRMFSGGDADDGEPDFPTPPTVGYTSLNTDRCWS